MKYECAKCQFITPARKDIRAHVRKIHKIHGGASSGSELPINRIPTHAGENSRVYRAPLKTITDQVKERMQKFEEWRSKWIQDRGGK